MVDVALGQRKALDMLIANAGHGSVLKENSLTDEDWEEIISDHVQLKMFFVASQVLVAENYPTLHLVHEIYVRLINKLESQVTDRNKAMVEKLRDYWGKLPTESGLAAILDPHLKLANSLHQTRTGKADSAKALRARSNLFRTHSGIYAEFNPRPFEANISPPTPKRQRSALDEFMDLTEGDLDDPMSGSANVDAIDVGQEVDLYCAAPVADRRVKSLDWWKSHDKEFPTLAAMARDWLAIPASSVPCESLFSVAGNTITSNRNRLNPETARGLLSLKSWWAFDGDLGMDEGDD